MLKHLMLAAVLSGLVILVSEPAKAEGADSSPCAALSGAPWGLCSAGIAVGCHVGKGDPRSCRQIEKSFLRVAGREAPWVVPPAECPCDFSVIPKTSPPWVAGTSNPISFQCPSFPGPTVLQSFVLAAGTIVHITVDAVLPMSCSYLEQADERAITDSLRIPLAQEQAMACRQEIITYGRKFMLLNPTVPIDDACSPTLP